MARQTVPYKIIDMKHRVSVCTMQDVAMTAEGVMSLTRTEVYNCWACIRPVRLSMFSVVGFGIQEDRSERTHEILVRNRRDIDFSSAAWIYEKRLKSGDRWYKLLRCVVYEEKGEYMQFDARIIERGDTLSKPSPVSDTARSILEAIPMPDNVKLN